MGLLRQPWVWLLGAVMVGGLVHMSLYLLPFEDAYISFRYAENLANGHGFVFNPGGPPVEGFTSFGWVVLLALAHVLGGVVPDAAVVLSVCCGLGLLGVTAVVAAGWRGRVDAWVVGMHCDLCALTRLACDRLDFDHPFVDLRDLDLEQLDQ